MPPETWIDDHGDALFRYANQRLRNASHAEDVVQEALLAGLKSWQKFSGGSSERTWLIGILRHKILDLLRQRGKALQTDVGGASDKQGEAADLDALFSDGLWRRRPLPPESLPADPLERAELVAELARAIEELPEQMRDALYLREIDGLESRLVCELLEISTTNLWTLVHRAKLRLRERLSAFGQRRRGSV